MFPVKNNGLGLIAQPAKTPGGFWKNLWGKVKKAIQSNLIGDILVTLGEGIASLFDQNKLIIVDELSDQEALILTNWDTQKFTPFYEALMTKVKAAFVPGVQIAAQLVVMNEVQRKICAARQHFSISTDGLTSQGIAVRNSYISNSFKLFENLFEKIIAANPAIQTAIDSNFLSTSVNLSPLVTLNASATFRCNNYFLSQHIPIGNQQPVITLPELTVDVYDDEPIKTNQSETIFTIKNGIKVGIGLVLFSMIFGKSKK